MVVHPNDWVFWTLPPEIRVIIYSLVYGEGRTITPYQHDHYFAIKPKGSYQRVGDSSDSDDFEKTVADKRMICKRYSRETLRHLAESNLFVTSRRIGNVFTVPKSFLQHVRSMRLQWSAYGDTSKIDLCKFCPELRHLQLQVDSTSLGVSSPNRPPGRPGFSIDSMHDIAIVKTLSLVRGLRSFVLIDNASGHCLSEHRAGQEAREAWRASLEEEIRAMVLLPKAEPIQRERGS